MSKKTIAIRFKGSSKHTPVNFSGVSITDDNPCLEIEIL